MDILRLARDLKIPHLDGGGDHHARPNWVQFHCPQCNSIDNKWHLGIAKNGGPFVCWRCGRLPFWPTLTQLLRVQEDEAREIVQPYLKNNFFKPRIEVERKKEANPPPDLGPLIEAHKAYLRNRPGGFDPDVLVQDWSLQATTYSSGDWNWRIVYPIKNCESQIVAWQGRSIGAVTPKYKLSSNSDCSEDPSTLLYGIEKCHEDYVIVVEGVTGVWRFGPGAVALLGSKFSQAQIQTLSRFKRRFVCLDPYPFTALKQAHKLANELSLYPGETELLRLDKQPGDLTPAEAAKLLACLKNSPYRMK